MRVPEQPAAVASSSSLPSPTAAPKKPAPAPTRSLGESSTEKPKKQKAAGAAEISCPRTPNSTPISSPRPAGKPNEAAGKIVDYINLVISSRDQLDEASYYRFLFAARFLNIAGKMHKLSRIKKEFEEWSRRGERHESELEKIRHHVPDVNALLASPSPDSLHIASVRFVLLTHQFKLFMATGQVVTYAKHPDIMKIFQIGDIGETFSYFGLWLLLLADCPIPASSFYDQHKKETVQQLSKWLPRRLFLFSLFF